MDNSPLEASVNRSSVKFMKQALDYNQFLKSKNILLVSGNGPLLFRLMLMLRKMQIKAYVIGPEDQSPLCCDGLFCKRYFEYSHDDMGYKDDKHVAAFSDKMVHFINQVCDRYQIDVLLPVDYSVMLSLSRYKDLLHKTVHVTPYPTESTLLFLNNKWKFSRLLNELHLPQPESCLIKAAEQVEHIDLHFPVMVKPLENGGGFGIYKLDSKTQVREYVNQLDFSPHGLPIQCQSHVEGKDFHVYGLAVHGVLKAWSMCCCSRPGWRSFVTNSAMLRACKSIIRESNYDGVFLFDLIYDPVEKDFYFLEMNLRFGASALYHYNAGVNYLEMALLTGLGVDVDDVFSPAEEGEVCKSFFDGILTRGNEMWVSHYTRRRNVHGTL